MSVGDEHCSERPPLERVRNRVEVFRLPDAGIDQRRHPAGEQERVVPGRPGPCRRVARLEKECVRHAYRANRVARTL